jgi:hypothetical protein
MALPENAWRVAILVLCSWLAGCRGAPPVATAMAAQQIDDFAAVQEALVTWFECDECTSGELDRVVALGKRAVPSLAATLDGGPSPARVERSRLQLERSYDDLVAYARGRPSIEVPLTREAFVAVHLTAQSARWQARAAVALGRIGTPEARAFLRTALDRPLQTEVRKSVEAALR